MRCGVLFGVLFGMKDACGLWIDGAFATCCAVLIIAVWRLGRIMLGRAEVLVELEW